MTFLKGLGVFQFFLCCVICTLALGGCHKGEGSPSVNAKLIFPTAAPLAHRHRNHSMTESPDGLLRIYAAQMGDTTDLMIMHYTDRNEWTEPALLDLPRRETNTSPRFSSDGRLYYSSDAPHPDRPGRRDLNIWSVSYEDGAFGTPEVLPDSINTGSHEDGFAPLGADRAVFSSTTLGGVGGYDLYFATRQDGLWTVEPFPHNSKMADSHPVVAHNGRTLLWYAHLPSDEVYGSVDLFVSQRQGDQWSEPENLGPTINTAGIDFGPGISADGETLFFSREGILMEADLNAVIKRAGYVALE